MLSIKDVLDKKIDGLVKLKAYFYALGGINESAFLTDNIEACTNQKIILPNDIIKLIIEQDETFGVLVGGEYAYYAMDSIVEGFLIFKDQQPYLSKVSKITLFDGELTQCFIF